MHRCDILIIGAGVAGVSVAAALAPRYAVVLVDKEMQPSSHATARSAAVFARNYGSPCVRALTRASESFFRYPRDGFSRAALFKPRPIIEIASVDQQDRLLESAAQSVEPRFLDTHEILTAAPILRVERCAMGLIDEAAGDLDVHELISAWMRTAKSEGAKFCPETEVLDLARKGAGWRAQTNNGDIDADIVVNAAGAWAGVVARMAGLTDLDLAPLRRTALAIEAPSGASHWPMIVDVEEQFYFKPMSGQLMLSPADAAPTPPCDAAAEEWDVAVAVDRFEAATTCSVKRILARWAGLRTFAPDENPVVGFDPRCQGFFWLAGQGGFGIQTAPALAAAAAALIEGGALPESLLEAGVGLSEIEPKRLRRGKV